MLAFVQGDLPPAELVRVGCHLDECADCLAIARDATHADPSRTSTLHEATVSRGSSASLLPGAQVGRHVILGEIGRGAMGVVYCAHDPSLDRDIALKVLRAPDAETTDQQPVARLLREAQAMARLAHPNVVAIYDVGSLEGAIYLAMELVAGQTLRDILRAAPRAYEDLIDIFLQAGTGLAAAHTAGIVHRDFKPANVLVGKDGRVRITDFGLARPATSFGAGQERANAKALRLAWGSPMQMTRSGVITGTPAYMAPEQFLCEPADARTDQFAFCVAMYEALFHERPFAGNSFEDLASAVLAGRLRPPSAESRVPAGIRAVLIRGLSTIPDHRYPSMGELLLALVEASRKGDLSFSETPSNVRAKRRWPLFAATTLVIAVTGALLVRGGANRSDSAGAAPALSSSGAASAVDAVSASDVTPVAAAGTTSTTEASGVGSASPGSVRALRTGVTRPVRSPLSQPAAAARGHAPALMDPLSDRK